MKADPSQRPLVKVARQIVGHRLEVVWKHARPAAGKWRDDVEHVHRLRVSTRRAREALRLFADLVPARDYRWMVRSLGRLRTSAGDARDLDVFGLRLRDMEATGHEEAVAKILARVKRDRKRAQKPLRRQVDRLGKRKFRKRSRALVKAMRWRGDDPPPRFGDAARSRMGPVVQRFLSAARGNLADMEELHALRIAGKRVRYALDLVHHGLGRDAERKALSRTFASVQEDLGDINDHVTAISFLGSRAGRSKNSSVVDLYRELIELEEWELSCKCRAFLDGWTRSRVAQLERAFRRILVDEHRAGW